MTMMMTMTMMFQPFPFFGAVQWCKAWWSPLGNLTADWAKYKGGQKVDHTDIIVIVIILDLP